MKDGRLRGRHPQRHHRSAGESVLPVSRRARPGRCAPRRHLRHQRSRARVEAVVLPLEHDPRRRAAAARHRWQTERRPPCSTSRCSACSPIRVPMTLASNFVHQWLDMKRLDEIVPDSAVFPYASGRSDPRDGFPHRADAVRRQHLQGRPQRRRSAEREPHVPQRAHRAALRDHRRERRSFPPGRARRNRRAGGCSARAPC